MEDVPAKDHAWSVEYNWSEDGKRCTATHICGNDANHNQTEDAAISSEETKAPTCTEKGKTTYTATFAEAWATEQTKTVEDVAALGHDYEWIDNRDGTCTGTCKNDVTHIILNESHYLVADGCSKCDYCELVFELNADGTGYILTGKGKDFKGGAVTIPAYIDGKPVTQIGYCEEVIVDGQPHSKFNSPFAWNSGITTVVIPDTVTRIAEGAFYRCETLVSIEIPASVQTIGKGAFHKCLALSKLTFAADGNLTTIGAYAFSSCFALTSVEIPASVTSIGWAGFDECRSLSDIRFAANSKLTILDGQAFASTAIASIKIPATVSTIGGYAFQNCSNLKSISIPSGVKKIDFWQFINCTNLESITIPASVTFVDHDAFSGCSALTDVYYTGSKEAWNQVAIGNNVTEEGNNGNVALKNATIHYNVVPSEHEYDRFVKVDATCTEDGYSGDTCPCGYIRNKQILPATGHSEENYDAKAPTCTEIGWNAYVTCSRCSYSTYVVKAATGHANADKWTDNGDGTCSDICTNGCGTALETKEHQIDANGCVHCTYHAFTYNVVSVNGQKEVHLLTAGKDIDDLIDENGVLTIPEYINGMPVTTIGYGTTENIDGKDYFVGISPFRGNTDITSVIIPNTVKRIYRNSFDGCTNLVNVTFEEGCQLTILENWTFRGTAIKTIEIPDSITVLDEQVFYTCTQLESVTFGTNSQLEIIYNHAFYGCTSLKEITIPDKVHTIEAGAFQGCTALTSVTFGPDSELTKICNYAFYYCQSLSRIEIPKGVTEIGDGTNLNGCRVFDYCTALEYVYIPAGITRIEERTFGHCESLTEVEFAEDSQLITLGKRAFYACYNLKTIKLPASVVTIEDEPFYDCPLLENVELGAAVESIGMQAFYFNEANFKNQRTNLYIYYAGSEVQWNNITLGGGNSAITNATKYYNAKISE